MVPALREDCRATTRPRDGGTECWMFDGRTENAGQIVGVGGPAAARPKIDACCGRWERDDRHPGCRCGTWHHGRRSAKFGSPGRIRTSDQPVYSGFGSDPMRGAAIPCTAYSFEFPHEFNFCCGTELH